MISLEALPPAGDRRIRQSFKRIALEIRNLVPDVQEGDAIQAQDGVASYAIRSSRPPA